jgi:hypothetical protein
MKITLRVSRLERSQAFPKSVLDRYCAAENEIALRLTGHRLDDLAADDQRRELVEETLSVEYLRSLSDADLAELDAEFERLMREAGEE